MAGGNDDVTLVLVHGANGGAWYWDLIGPELDARGIRWVALDLPSVGEGVDPATDCHADAAHVRAVVDGVSGPVVLCGSSYGGVVITEASADHDRVRHLVYLAAFMLDADEEIPAELFAHCSPALLESAAMDEAGRLLVDPNRVGDLYLTQASPEVVSWYGSRMRPMALGGPTRLTGVGWHHIPSTYVVCTEDPAVLPASQRQWAQTRATNRIEVPFDHLPEISHPAETADVLANIVRDQVRAQPSAVGQLGACTAPTTAPGAVSTTTRSARRCRSGAARANWSLSFGSVVRYSTAGRQAASTRMSSATPGSPSLRSSAAAPAR